MNNNKKRNKQNGKLKFRFFFSPFSTIDSNVERLRKTAFLLPPNQFAWKKHSQYTQNAQKKNRREKIEINKTTAHTHTQTKKTIHIQNIATMVEYKTKRSAKNG